MNPTARAASLVGVAAIAALLIPVRVAALAGVVVIALTIVDAAIASTHPRLTRSVAPVVARGVRAPLRVSVGARRFGRIRVRQPRTADFTVDPAESRGPLDATLVAHRRGRHVLPDVAARCTGPLGLAEWNFRGEGRASVTVYPDVPRARRIALAVRQGRFAEAGRLRRGPLGIGTEFESIRDHQPDDDIRQINWLATSRAGRLMTNQFRVEQDRDVIALLDTGRLMSAPVEDQTRLDAAIDALTAVAAVSEVVGDRCGVIAFDHEIRRSTAARRRGADALTAAIYDLEPRPVDADYELAFRSVRNTKRALVIVFTDILDGSAADSLVRAVPVLSRRHAVIVASVADNDIDRLAGTRHDTTTGAAGDEDAQRGRAADEAVWRQVVARHVLATRQQVVAQLRACDATFVEASPRQFAEAMVATYLRLKARARL
jgi:uncharacterized protein (DUF58 family)